MSQMRKFFKQKFQNVNGIIIIMSLFSNINAQSIIQQKNPDNFSIKWIGQFPNEKIKTQKSTFFSRLVKIVIGEKKHLPLRSHLAFLQLIPTHFILQIKRQAILSLLKTD